jgi:hypothetical protein
MRNNIYNDFLIKAYDIISETEAENSGAYKGGIVDINVIETYTFGIIYDLKEMNKCPSKEKIDSMREKLDKLSQKIFLYDVGPFNLQPVFDHKTPNDLIFLLGKLEGTLLSKD